jgi:hypothetical protein
MIPVPDKRFGVNAVWLFAALAMVFAPALDGPEITGFKQPGLSETTLGPRILAPFSSEAVAQGDRSAGLVTEVKTELPGLLASVVLTATLFAVAVVVLKQSAASSRVLGSRKSTRGPPALAS